MFPNGWYEREESHEDPDTNNADQRTDERCAQGSFRRFQRLHRFSPNPNIYNNLGNLLFARLPTQVASRDDVQTQF
jgi:hypothetical protein